MPFLTSLYQNPYFFVYYKQKYRPAKLLPHHNSVTDVPQLTKNATQLSKVVQQIFRTLQIGFVRLKELKIEQSIFFN